MYELYLLIYSQHISQCQAHRKFWVNEKLCAEILSFPLHFQKSWLPLKVSDVLLPVPMWTGTLLYTKREKSLPLKKEENRNEKEEEKEVHEEVTEFQSLENFFCLSLNCFIHLTLLSRGPLWYMLSAWEDFCWKRENRPYIKNDRCSSNTHKLKLKVNLLNIFVR